MARKTQELLRSEETAKRVKNSEIVLGDVNYQPKEERPVLEGVHYKVLAYTDWADNFIPTIVEWKHGAVDSFMDLSKSLTNRSMARQAVNIGK